MRVRKLVLQVGVVCLIGALIGLLGWRLLSQQEAKGLIASIQRGDRPAAPDFELPKLGQEGTLKLSDLRGQVVVLNVWASWCNPCREEAPALQAAYERWRDKGVLILGVDYRDLEGDALAFRRRFGLTYPSVKDGSGSIIGRYGVTGVPETFFVDRSGKIVSQVLAQISPDTLNENIQLALKP